MMLCAYLIPQLLFRRTSCHWIATLLPFYSGAALVDPPAGAALSFLHSLLDITTPEAERDEPATSAENIEALITAGTEEGLIEEDDRKLIQSVVAFGDKVVREVMTPRPNIVAIQADETLEALRELVVNEQYSRIPVFETSIDDVIGFVHVRDMFEVPESDRLTRTVSELMRPIRFVPETKPVNDLMREMQQEGAHMVIVVDEYGNTAGLATHGRSGRSDPRRNSRRARTQFGRHRRWPWRLHRLRQFRHRADRRYPRFQTGRRDRIDDHRGARDRMAGPRSARRGSVERDGIRIEVLASDEMRVEQVRLSKAPAGEKREPELEQNMTQKPA